MEIFRSATKTVFVLMAISTVALTFIGIVEAKDFMMMTGMAFTYYFTKNNSQVV